MFDECALLTLLKLVGFEAWAKRSRFARDGEEGPTWAGRRPAGKGEQQGEDSAGLSAEGLVLGSLDWAAAQLLGAPANAPLSRRDLAEGTGIARVRGLGVCLPCGWFFSLLI